MYRTFISFLFLLFLVTILGFYGNITLQTEKTSDLDTKIDCRNPNHSIVEYSEHLTYNGHEYVLYANPKTWSEAKVDCESRGGNLVTITSQEENDFVSSLTEEEDGVWIGFIDEVTEGDWQWVTGEPVTYTDWASEEPNNSGEGEDYASIYSWGEWNDLSDEETHYYICEWEDNIFINGNADFISQAAAEDWSGDGSKANPYIINNKVLDGSSGDLISISNTDLHFQIINCLLTNGGGAGISLNNVMNGYIYSNSIHDNNWIGIRLEFSDNNVICSNIVYNSNPVGISLFSSSNDSIYDNQVYNTDGAGFWIEQASNYNTITNNSIDSNSANGILITDSHNTLIANNTVFNNDGAGIGFDHCEQSNIVNNTIYGQHPGGGINLLSSPKNNISSNTVFKIQSWAGIAINQESDNCSVFNNQVYSNEGNGILIENADNNRVCNNRAFDNTYPGIRLDTATNTYIFNNSLYLNKESGIWLFEYCYRSEIVNNTLYSNGNGISLRKSEDNIISYNIIYSNNGGGVILEQGSDDNRIIFNNLSGNNAGGHQAYDDGSNNVFAFNYWDDWTIPDADTDGIVDNPYIIDGGNQDPYPLTSQYSTTTPDILTSPILLLPNGGEFLGGIEPIQWLPVIDSLGHDVEYSINYSVDNGLTWEILVSELTTTNYSWNTSTVADGSTYLMKVIAHCSEGEIADDTSDGMFSVHNFLPSPTILSPSSGEILNGTIPIQWSVSSDLFGHDVTYAVYYSSDNGNTWNLLISGLDSNGYNWDTTALIEGINFTIRVVATCTEGVTAEDVFNGSFMVHYLIAPTISSSFGNDPLKGMVTIHWAASIDSLGQDVTYSVYYSSDNGSTWNLLISRLDSTNYAWNTTNVPDGTNYKIKVVATSLDGSVSEDILERTFSVHNAQPPPPDFSFLILGLAFIPVIPELYFGRRLSKTLSRKSEEGVRQT